MAVEVCVASDHLVVMVTVMVKAAIVAGYLMIADCSDRLQDFV